MKKIMLLGGSAQQVIAIETAKKLGYYTVLCDYLTDNPGQYHADKFYLVSTTDKAAVLDVAKKENIDGVLAYASDPAAPTAAYVAENLGLPTNPYESVETLCNKDRFREFLKNNGFNTPKAKWYTDKEAVLREKDYFSYPIIIKPVDSSGSKGVKILKSPEGFADAVNFAFSFSHCGKIIIEEYIVRKHKYTIGGDIFVDNGKIIIWGLMNCFRDHSPNPLVPGGKFFPLMINNDDCCAVKKTLQELVDKLNIKSGCMNVELMIDNDDRVYMIDIGPRAGGNMIPIQLSAIFGVDIVEMSVKVAMREPLNVCPEVKIPYCATYVLHSKTDGIYQDILFDKELEQYIFRKEIYKKPGDAVEAFDNAAKALGIIFLRFDSMEQMLDMMDNSEKWIKVVLK